MTRFTHIRQSSFFWLVTISCVVALSLLGIRQWGWLESLELQAYDWTLRLQSADSSFSPPIVLVTITDEDIYRLDRWPISDATLAKTLEIILQDTPRVVGFDIYRDLEVPPGREVLNEVLSRHRELVGIMKFGSVARGGIRPPTVLEGTDQVGFSDILVDRDGVVRRGLLFLDDGGQVSLSFALVLALRYLEAEGITLQADPVTPEHVRLGSVTLPPLESEDGAYIGADAKGYQFLLDFDGGRQSFPRVSLHDVLERKTPPGFFKDATVITAVEAVGVKDLFTSSYAGIDGKTQGLHGGDLHARIVSQLLRMALAGKTPIRSWPEGQEHLWIVCWSLMGGLAGWWCRGIARFSLALAGGLVTVVALGVAAMSGGWWIPVVPPLFGWALSLSLMTAYMVNREKHEREMVMQLFSRHVSPEVADMVWQARAQFMEGGRLHSQQLIVTALFSDLEGFTAVAERMAPEELMRWLNHYMETMAGLVMDHGGVVDDYYGDAIKANFGVPLPRTEDREIRQDAVQAVTCAQAMRQALGRLNQEWQGLGLPTVRMRVGIETGPVVVGSLGSAQRLKYTTIGDTVNIAARLESFEKVVHPSSEEREVCRILIGETTYRYVHDLWPAREVGEVSLKGKARSVRVYQIEPER